MLKMTCAKCGSENVMRDAYAVWNFDTQDWELGAVFDQGYCDDCARTGNSETDIDEADAEEDS